MNFFNVIGCLNEFYLEILIPLIIVLQTAPNNIPFALH